MSSALKLLVPLALLVGVVFAVTYFSRYTPDDPDPASGGGTATPAAGAKPLVFFTTARRWDPTSASLPDRVFPGFFEIGDESRSAAFWFENRNQEPVTLQLKGVSCTACSGGRVAAIPPAVVRQLLQVSFGSMLPQGLTTGLAAAGVAGPAANFDRDQPALDWQAYTFAEHAKDLSRVQYTVPAAEGGDVWSPRWGILDLNFKVRPSPQLPLTADFLSRIGATEQVGADRFSIMYRAASPLEVDRDSIDLRELSSSSPDQKTGFVAFTTTRSDFPPPTIRVDLPAGAAGEVGEWVTAGPPVRMTPDQLTGFMAELSMKAKEPVKVAAAYLVPVVVRAKVGDRPADLGRLERVVYVAHGSDSRQVQVKANVRGLVYLAGEAKEIAFGGFRGSEGATATYDLTTEKAGTELTWFPDQTVPKYLKVELDRRPDRGDYGSYRIKVTIPKNELVGELPGGVVVLGVNGPTQQRIRIPVSGRATR